MKNSATVVMPNSYVVQYRDMPNSCRFKVILLGDAKDLAPSIEELYPHIEFDNLTEIHLVLVLEFVRRAKR